MRLFEPPVVAPFGGKQRSFLSIIFGITEVFGPDGSFAAPAGFRIVTNEPIWLFKCKRLPTPGLAVPREDYKTYATGSIRGWSRSHLTY